MVDTLTTPPVGRAARVEAGTLLRRLQKGEAVGMPHSRPMPGIGPRVHELRVNDLERSVSWRIVCRVDLDAILIVHWFEKKTEKTRRAVIETCRNRIRAYDRG